jgi:hypothetical protein
VVLLPDDALLPEDLVELSRCQARRTQLQQQLGLRFQLDAEQRLQDGLRRSKRSRGVVVWWCGMRAATVLAAAASPFCLVV